MPFSQANVLNVRAIEDGADLFISWSTTSPLGTVFQVYVDRRLAWSGRDRSCHVVRPAEASGRTIWIDVGAVEPTEAMIDFSTGPASPALTGRVVLSWKGGTYLDSANFDDIQGFRIYRSNVAGGPVDLSQIVGDVPAYPGRWITDGFGLGGFGEGRFGRSATHYRWESGRLGPGAWSFAVVPYDVAGNVRGVSRSVTATVVQPPRPPAPFPNGGRLTIEYAGPILRTATLNWQASPPLG